MVLDKGQPCRQRGREFSPVVWQYWQERPGSPPHKCAMTFWSIGPRHLLGVGTVSLSFVCLLPSSFLSLSPVVQNDYLSALLRCHP